MSPAPHDHSATAHDAGHDGHSHDPGHTHDAGAGHAHAGHNHDHAHDAGAGHAHAGHNHDHSHSHSHGHSHAPRGGRALAVVLVMTTVILVAEVVGGIASGSLALLADAGHMFSDSAGLLLAGVALVVGRRPANAAATYGFRRAEVLAAAVNAVAIAAISVWILVAAFQRLGKGVEVETGLMMVVALIGLAANVVSAVILNRSAGESLNIRGAYLHVLADLLGSVAVIVAGLVITFTGWTPADTVASVLIVLIILPRTWSLFRQAWRVLMEQVPAGVDVEGIRRRVEAVPGVSRAHDLHVWSVDGEGLVATVHVVRDGEAAAGCGMLDAVHAVLRADGIGHATVQVEDPGHAEHEEARCDAPEGVDEAGRPAAHP
ncbi:cation diffusion facilitator family transporter [Corynebacterium bovis]|uniref:Cobalt-zinc-cadmium efflux system protein n=1 Tax=Corynebacterium bovis DSM 20582 = CIP 54.80 TaxID=927655 RepID=A0A8H9Y817_9CORY|nr:cation diffusion facilitator family transporter [Corynebacterium bovis]MBB3116313.1 cobalt-zinc-cadmium efflux system protein [Corynebacterium bovis DSM 20582 = CIP 54.80]WJY77369.1 Cadmium, cobalt and zinc/H(+)-K(+) antiporter [Corynebacterium bovis DSM 20582 = CIP 54.80]